MADTQSTDSVAQHHAAEHAAGSAAPHQAHSEQPVRAKRGQQHGRGVFAWLSNAKPWLAPAITTGVICFVMALIMFYPITGNMAGSAPGGGGDTYLALWDIWWVNYATFTLHTGIFYTHSVFWPVGANLAYQTMAPIGALLVGPWQAISIPFAYNMFFFLGYAFAGFTMFLLAYYLTGNKYAAFLAAVFFSFSAFHIAEAYSHIDWVNVAWVPLAFLFLLKLVRDDKKFWNALGLAVSFVLITFMGDIEQAIMMGMALVMVIAAYALVPRTRSLLLNKRFAGAFAVFVILTLVLGSWGFVPMASTVLQPGGLSSANFLNDFQHNELWSADFLAFFLPSQYNGLLSGISGAWASIYSADVAERTAYIGYVVLALAVYGVWKQWRQSRMWLGIGIVFALMALGPYVQVGSYLTPIPGIYQIYHAIPVINVIREPGRFDLMVTVAAAVLAAFGAKYIFEKARSPGASFLRDRALVVVIILALFLFENNGLPVTASLQSQVVTQISVPTLYTELASVSGNFSVLNLPILPDYGNATQPQLYVGKSTYYGAVAEKPIVGGDITRENASQAASVLNVPLAVQASLLQPGNINYYSLSSCAISSVFLSLWSTMTFTISVPAIASRYSYVRYPYWSELLVAALLVKEEQHVAVRSRHHRCICGIVCQLRCQVKLRYCTYARCRSRAALILYVKRSAASLGYSLEADSRVYCRCLCREQRRRRPWPMIRRVYRYAANAHGAIGICRCPESYRCTIDQCGRLLPIQQVGVCNEAPVKRRVYRSRR